MHRVHTSASVGERKFAEKLTILVERSQGILTRVYNIKKVPGCRNEMWWCSLLVENNGWVWLGLFLAQAEIPLHFFFFFLQRPF